MLEKEIESVLCEVLPDIPSEQKKIFKEKLSVVVDNHIKNSISNNFRFLDFLDSYPYYPYMSRLENIENKIDSLLKRETQNLNYCKFDSQSRNMQLIVTKGNDEKEKALNYLSQKLLGAEYLVICDPFLLSYKAKNFTQTKLENFANELVAIIPDSVQKIDFFTKPNSRNPIFAKALNDKLRQKNISICSYKTDDIHDRVWIVNHQKAFIVGTSFNGLANKCSFILDLPSEDLMFFQQKLDEIKRTKRKSKSA